MTQSKWLQSGQHDKSRWLEVAALPDRSDDGYINVIRWFLINHQMLALYTEFTMWWGYSALKPVRTDRRWQAVCDTHPRCENLKPLRQSRLLSLRSAIATARYSSISSVCTGLIMGVSFGSSCDCGSIKFLLSHEVSKLRDCFAWKFDTHLRLSGGLNDVEQYCCWDACQNSKRSHKIQSSSIRERI